jgi:hypothetical protein
MIWVLILVALATLTYLYPKNAFIKTNKYDFSINPYEEVVYQQEQYESPKMIIKQLKKLEMAILADLDELEAML